jgi:hypothetical protein
MQTRAKPGQAVRVIPSGCPSRSGDADRHIVLTGLEEHSRHASQIIGQDE